MISNFNQLQTLYLEIILQFLHYLNSTSCVSLNPPKKSTLVIIYRYTVYYIFHKRSITSKYALNTYPLHKENLDSIYER